MEPIPLATRAGIGPGRTEVVSVVYGFKEEGAFLIWRLVVARHNRGSLAMGDGQFVLLGHDGGSYVECSF